MAMKLIRKMAPRGALKRRLSEDEKTAVKNFSALKQARNAQEQALAENIAPEDRTGLFHIQWY